MNMSKKINNINSLFEQKYASAVTLKCLIFFFFLELANQSVIVEKVSRFLEPLFPPHTYKRKHNPQYTDNKDHRSN